MFLVLVPLKVDVVSRWYLQVEQLGCPQGEMAVVMSLSFGKLACVV